MIKVLVVDDSSFMRASLVAQIEKDQEIQVAGTARDGVEALQKAEQLDPDVITLDVEMPRMGGLETLKRLMETNPLPVLMVSSLTEEGAETTLKALELGALDFIPKTLSTDKDAFGAEIRKRLKVLSRRKSIVKLKYRRIHRIVDAPQAPAFPSFATPARTGRAAPLPPLGHAGASPAARLKARPGAAPLAGVGMTFPQPTQPQDYVQTPLTGPRDLVVIGVSTGGPPVVQKVLSALPADLPACILVAQHMPPAFTGPFAKRLDKMCRISVTEAVDGDKFKFGHAYVCPGGKHIGVRMRGPLPEIAVTDEPQDALYKPTVNVLMETAGRFMPHRTLGVMLTGMGADGCEGAKVLREKGGCLIAQSEATCVVYGMPKAVVDAKLANQILDADDIAGAIIKTVRG